MFPLNIGYMIEISGESYVLLVLFYFAIFDRAKSTATVVGLNIGKTANVWHLLIGLVEVDTVLIVSASAKCDIGYVATTTTIVKVLLMTLFVYLAVVLSSILWQLMSSLTGNVFAGIDNMILLVCRIRRIGSQPVWFIHLLAIETIILVSITIHNQFCIKNGRYRIIYSLF